MFQRVFLFLFLIPSIAFTYTVVRTDGRTFSGELLEQNAEQIVIKDDTGIIVKFKADQIDWQKTTTAIRSEEARKNPEPGNFNTREISRTRRSNEWTGELISIDFKDIDIKDFFRFIAEISGMNMILDPAVKGSLTIKLTDVPWDQALDVVCRTYGYGYEISGNVMNVDKF